MKVCTVLGCIMFGKERSEDELLEIRYRLRRMLYRGADRGRDSFGVVGVRKNGELDILKAKGIPKLSPFKIPVRTDTALVIANNRAEPTTEYSQRKDNDHIQPFVGRTIVVSHNGTISNDKELEARLNLQRTSKIDSAILPPLLEKIWNGSAEHLAKILRDEVVGSFALAVADTRQPNTLYLAVNYKPMFLQYKEKLRALYFASMDYYFDDFGKPLWKSSPVRQLSPYTLLRIDTKMADREISLWKSRHSVSKARKRVLAVCSAGLDSTVAATILKVHGYKIDILHFRYRHRAERKESESIHKIAKTLGCRLIELDLDFFENTVRSSSLINRRLSVRKDGMSGAELAHEWVPARNLVFLSLATAYAEEKGYDYISIGVNLEEAGAYSDNEMIFVRKFNEVLPFSTNLQKRIEVLMPVGNLVKHEIVKLGIKVHAPLDLTWSCYEGGQKHCGKCGPCFMRKTAFKIAGIVDPVEYE